MGQYFRIHNINTYSIRSYLPTYVYYIQKKNKGKNLRYFHKISTELLQQQVNSSRVYPQQNKKSHNKKITTTSPGWTEVTKLARNYPQLGLK